MPAAGTRAWNQPSPQQGSPTPPTACRSATPAAGVTGYLSQTAFSAGITGRMERYTCAAEPEIRAAAAKLNGFVVIVTQAADPHQLTPDGLMDAFASSLTLVGWAQL